MLSFPLVEKRTGTPEMNFHMNFHLNIHLIIHKVVHKVYLNISPNGHMNVSKMFLKCF